MTHLEKTAEQISPRGWETLGLLRKYPDRPKVLHRQHSSPLIRMALVRVVDVETNACVMTELGQLVWTRHGPVDDGRWL